MYHKQQQQIAIAIVIVTATVTAAMNRVSWTTRSIHQYPPHNHNYKQSIPFNSNPMMRNSDSGVGVGRGILHRVRKYRTAINSVGHSRPPIPLSIYSSIFIPPLSHKLFNQSYPLHATKIMEYYSIRMSTVTILHNGRWSGPVQSLSIIHALFLFPELLQHDRRFCFV